MSDAAVVIAAWATSVRDQDVPDEVRAYAVRHLVDAFGAAAAAARSGVAAPSMLVAAELGGPPEATLLGSRIRIGAPAAALATGTLVHALDFDDTHAIGLIHPTSVVLPAALAVGQSGGATGRDLLSAVVVGYEVAARIAAATPYGFHQRGLHATSIAGVFSSAAVASRLMALDASTCAHALGIAGSSAGGLLEFLGTQASTKQLHPGLTSHAGILAARLARAGATGPASVLEGPRGLYAALADAQPDLEVLAGALGSRWETMRIGIKPYPACQLMHATLDAASAALAADARPLDPEDVVEVIAEVHPDSAAVVCDPGRDHARPLSPYDAKFSLPWSVGALLLDGTVSLATYSQESLARPAVGALADRVRTIIRPGSSAAADAPGIVTIVLRDGRRLEGTVRRSGGGPDDPLTDDALHHKFFTNAGDGTAAKALLQTIVSLDSLDDLDTLTGAFADAVQEGSS